VTIDYLDTSCAVIYVAAQPQVVDGMVGMVGGLKPLNAMYEDAGDVA
jgi:hypothetical protein